MNAKWITPAVTALDENGHIDIEANKRIYEHLIQEELTEFSSSAASVSFLPCPWRKSGIWCVRLWRTLHTG